MKHYLQTLPLLLLAVSVQGIPAPGDEPMTCETVETTAYATSTVTLTSTKTVIKTTNVEATATAEPVTVTQPGHTLRPTITKTVHHTTTRPEAVTSTVTGPFQTRYSTVTSTEYCDVPFTPVCKTSTCYETITETCSEEPTGWFTAPYDAFKPFFGHHVG